MMWTFTVLLVFNLLVQDLVLSAIQEDQYEDIKKRCEECAISETVLNCDFESSNTCGWTNVRRQWIFSDPKGSSKKIFVHPCTSPAQLVSPWICPNWRGALQFGVYINHNVAAPKLSVLVLHRNGTNSSLQTVERSWYDETTYQNLTGIANSPFKIIFTASIATKIPRCNQIGIVSLDDIIFNPSDACIPKQTQSSPIFPTTTGVYISTTAPVSGLYTSTTTPVNGLNTSTTTPVTGLNTSTTTLPSTFSGPELTSLASSFSMRKSTSISNSFSRTGSDTSTSTLPSTFSRTESTSSNVKFSTIKLEVSTADKLVDAPSTTSVVTPSADMILNSNVQEKTTATPDGDSTFSFRTDYEDHVKEYTGEIDDMLPLSTQSPTATPPSTSKSNQPFTLKSSLTRSIPTSHVINPSRSFMTIPTKTRTSTTAKSSIPLSHLTSTLITFSSFTAGTKPVMPTTLHGEVRNRTPKILQKGVVTPATVLRNWTTATPPKRFILLGKPPNLVRVDLDTNQISPVPMPKLKSSSAVTYDDQNMYWADPEEKIIRGSTLDGRNFRTVALLPDGSEPHVMTVDSSSNRLFFTDKGVKSVASVNTAGISELKYVVKTGLDKPRAIALDIADEVVYWSDTGNRPKIECAGYTGLSRTTVIEQDLGAPTALAIDATTRNLYWADSKLGRLEKSSLNGQGRVKVSTLAKGEFDYITLHNGNIYVTEQTDVGAEPKFYAISKDGGKPISYSILTRHGNPVVVADIIAIPDNSNVIIYAATVFGGFNSLVLLMVVIVCVKKYKGKHRSQKSKLNDNHTYEELVTSDYSGKTKYKSPKKTSSGYDKHEIFDEEDHIYYDPVILLQSEVCHKLISSDSERKPMPLPRITGPDVGPLDAGIVRIPKAISNSTFETDYHVLSRNSCYLDILSDTELVKPYYITHLSLKQEADSGSHNSGYLDILSDKELIKPTDISRLSTKHEFDLVSAESDGKLSKADKIAHKSQDDDYLVPFGNRLTQDSQKQPSDQGNASLNPVSLAGTLIISDAQAKLSDLDDNDYLTPASKTAHGSHEEDYLTPVSKTAHGSHEDDYLTPASKAAHGSIEDDYLVPFENSPTQDSRKKPSDDASDDLKAADLADPLIIAQKVQIAASNHDDDYLMPVKMLRA